VFGGKSKYWAPGSDYAGYEPQRIVRHGWLNFLSFKDIRVYDKRTDKEKGLFHKMYEMLVGGVADLLKSEQTSEVATKADISGKVKNSDKSTLQIIAWLIKNAFFKAIIPGFEREISRRRKH
jgi:hypothetical protein